MSKLTDRRRRLVRFMLRSGDWPVEDIACELGIPLASVQREIRSMYRETVERKAARTARRAQLTR